MDKVNVEKVVIDGCTYVREDTVSAPAETYNGERYCIVRSKSAGVFAGFVEDESEETIIMHNTRRIWYWSGATTLSQLALEGVSKPQDCKFAAPLPEIQVREVIEIIPASAKARECIEAVTIWRV